MSGQDAAALKSFYAFMTEGNNGRNRFRIAHFQRPYVWPERYVWQLMEDLWELYCTRKPSKPIGCVITHAAKSGIHEIVDGQQRLITLHLVFRAVLYWCRRHAAGKLADDLDNLFSAKSFIFKSKDSSGRGHQSQPRLMLFDADESKWFHEVFLSSPVDSDTAIDKILIDDDVPQQRLPFVNNFKTILSFLADRKGYLEIRGTINNCGSVLTLETADFQNTVRGGRPGDPGFYMNMQFDRDLKGLHDSADDLNNFCNYILEKVNIVHFVTIDAGMAVDIFNAMNRPGLPLAAPQRLKASLLVNIDYTTVDSASSVWNDAERKMMGLVGWDKEPLTPFLRCLLEITPKPPTHQSEDFFFNNPSLLGKFRKSPRTDILDEFQDFCVELRENGDLPPAHPTHRYRLYEKNGQPNTEAVGYFIENYLNGPLVPLFISLISLADQNSWGAGPYLANFGADAKAQVQNSVSCLRHLYHLELDQDWVYPALLASHLWGLYATTTVHADIVQAFFDRLEIFVAYLIIVRPERRKKEHTRDKDNPTVSSKAWVWPDKAAREDRMEFYRELMDNINRKAPGEVVEWLQLSEPEKHLFRERLPQDEDKLFPKESKMESDGKRMQQVLNAKVGIDLQQKVITYLLLKAEVALLPTSLEVMESFDGIAEGLRDQSSSVSSAVEEYRQFNLKPVLPRKHEKHTDDWKKAGWTQTDFQYLKDNLILGNLTLTLQSLNTFPYNFDNHNFKKFAEAASSSPELHGFLSTTKLLRVSPAAEQAFKKLDMKLRHRRLILLAQKSWSLLTSTSASAFDKELATLPSIRSGICSSNNRHAIAVFGQTNTELAEVDTELADADADVSDLDRILNSGPAVRVGAHVRIDGLRATPQLNGKRGVVKRFDDKKDRYEVEITDTKARKSLKQENLFPVSLPAPASQLQPRAKTLPVPVAKPGQRILPMPKRQAQVVEAPRARTLLCTSFSSGKECNLTNCRMAHSLDEWKCYPHSMGTCHCLGYVMSCPAQFSVAKRKKYGVETEPLEAPELPPLKRRRLGSDAPVMLKEVPKSAFPAHSPSSGGAPVSKAGKVIPPWAKPASSSSAEPVDSSTTPLAAALPYSSGEDASSNGSSCYEGYVMTLKPFKKFGFIKWERGQWDRRHRTTETFFHFDNLEPKGSLIRLNDWVSFNIGRDHQRRECATHVRRHQL